MYEFEVIGDIVGKQRPRVNMYTGNVYTPNKTKDYEELIKQCFFLKYQQCIMLNSKLKVEIKAYFKIPKNTSSAKRKLMLDNIITPTKKPDIDNIAKIVLDAINKYIIQDDNQVTQISIEKKYAEQSKLAIKIEEY